MKSSLLLACALAPALTGTALASDHRRLRQPPRNPHPPPLFRDVNTSVYGRESLRFGINLSYLKYSSHVSAH